ncbi:MAG: hypothetical protein ACFB0B_03045 [Thermonemataceae bacterium]
MFLCRVISLIVIILGSSSSYLLSQNLLEDDFTKELVFGVSLNTNGGLPAGVQFKYGKIKNSQTNVTYGLEIVGIKHPKERRVINGNSPSGLPFIDGKENYLFSIRPEYGREGVLFRKASQEGVQVNAIFAVGPSIGIVKPYMIWYNVAPDASGQTLREIPYRPAELDPSRIYGRGSFFSGWDQTSVALGGHVKLGLSFEVSAFQKAITGIEVGFTHEVFDRTVTILNSNLGEVENSNSFTSAYLMFFFGARK